MRRTSSRIILFVFMWKSFDRPLSKSTKKDFLSNDIRILTTLSKNPITSIFLSNRMMLSFDRKLSGNADFANSFEKFQSLRIFCQIAWCCHLTENCWEVGFWVLTTLLKLPITSNFPSNHMMLSLDRKLLRSWIFSFDNSFESSYHFKFSVKSHDVVIWREIFWKVWISTNLLNFIILTFSSIFRFQTMLLFDGIFLTIRIDNLNLFKT